MGAIVVRLDAAGGFVGFSGGFGIDMEGVEMCADLLDGCEVLKSERPRRQELS